MLTMVKFLMIIISLGILGWSYFLQITLVRPLNIQILQTKNVTEVKLVSVAGETKRHLADSYSMVAKVSGLSVEFLISLSSTESNFNERAVSSKGYKGLMQIPYTVYYPDANILIGAHIFKEKMKLANGNLKKAICLYKGYDYNTDYGRRKAELVIMLYKKLLAMEV